VSDVYVQINTHDKQHMKHFRGTNATYFCKALPKPTARSCFFGFPLLDVPKFRGMLGT
jgi:hypothetical protein